MSIQLSRTNSDISRVLQIALTQQMNNPMLSSSVQIMNVETSADLSTCKVFVDIRHDKPDMVMFQLIQASAFLKRQIADKVKLRRVPNITFIQDKGRQNAERVEELLSTINAGKV